RKQATWRNTPQPKLDWRKPTRERDLHSAATRQTRTASQRIREIHSCQRPIAEACADRPFACAIRNHSPLSRRQWADRPLDDCPPAGALGILEGSAPLSKPFLQAPSRRVLPAPQFGAAGRRLGRLD